MPRTMYDSTSAASIPVGAKMVAGYLDGLYKWPDADWARFPDATKVGIVVLPETDDGHVLDVEKGDASPEQAPAWCTMRRSHGCNPSVYCNLDTWPAVQQAFATQQVQPPRYWVAGWDGDPTIPDGAVAKQYANRPGYDMSTVADQWPGVDDGQTIQPVAPAQPAPVPQPTGANRGQQLAQQLRSLADQVAQL